MTEKIITFRVPLELDKEMKKLVEEERKDKSKILREILIIGIKEKKLEIAIKLYVDRKVTLWKAAKLAGISLWEMTEVIKERKIPLQYSQKELNEDLKALK